MWGEDVQKSFSKTSCGGSEKFDFKEGLIWVMAGSVFERKYREFLEKIKNCLIAV